MMADIDWVRRFCLALPGTTEQVQWEIDLVFKIGGKMYAVAPLEPAAVWISFKSDPESFAALTERHGIRPAAYLARAHWVSLETCDAVARSELEQLLRNSYELVLHKLPKRTQALISQARAAAPRKRTTRAGTSKTRRRPGDAILH
jgi:predicted DNA-binding protein (MmcQ/YjbR family)